MADQDVDFRLTARNETKAAFEEAKRGLEGLGESIANARGLMVSLGAAAGVQQFASLINQATAATARYKDLGEIAGTTAERISGLEMPARLAGKSLDEIAGAVAKLGKSLGEARLGDTGKAGLFGALGIDPKDGRDAAQVMVDVARALSGMQDQAIAGKVASELLGKSFAELRPFMKELVEQGGLVARVTDEQAEAADRYRDNLVRLSAIADQARLDFAAELLPVLNEIAEVMLKAGKETEAFAFAIKAGTVFFQTLAVVGSDVGFTFKMIGGEIGVIAAQLVALATFDFAGFELIGKEWRDDAAKARVELDAFQVRVMAVGKTIAVERDNWDLFGARGKAGGTNEDAVRALMEARRLYDARIAQQKGFAQQFSGTIMLSSKLISEAYKQAGIDNERTQVELMQRQSALREMDLLSQRRSLEAQKKLSADQGKDKEVAEAQNAIERVNAALVANEAITQAEIQSLRTVTAQKQQDQYNAAMALHLQVGESLAMSLRSEVDQENAAYEERLINLGVYLSSAQGQIADADALQQTLTQQHNLKLQQIEINRHQAERSMEMGTVQLAGELMQQFAGKSKAAAIAAIAISKGLAIAQTIQNTASAVMAAMAQVPWPGNLAAAAYVETLGAIQIGLIAATGLAQVSNLGSSGASSGSPASPISVTSSGGGQASGGFSESSSAAPALAVAEAPRSQINITIVGDMHSSESIRDLMKAIAEQATYGADIIVNQS